MAGPFGPPFGGFEQAVLQTLTQHVDWFAIHNAYMPLLTGIAATSASAEAIDAAQRFNATMAVCSILGRAAHPRLVSYLCIVHGAAVGYRRSRCETRWCRL